MNERSWERLGAGSGLVAAVLLLAGFGAAPRPPGLDAPAAAIVGYLGDHRAGVLTASLLVTLAVVAFLWFVAHLRHVLQRAEGGVEAFSPVVLVSGVSLAMTWTLGMVPLTALATLTARQAGPGESGAVRLLYGMHQLSLGPAGLLVALFAVSAGAAMVHRELAGPWLGRLGMAVAVIGLAAGVGSFFAAPSVVVMFLAYAMGIAFALWIAVASVVMLLHPEMERTTAKRGVFAR